MKDAGTALRGRVLLRSRPNGFMQGHATSAVAAASGGPDRAVEDSLAAACDPSGNRCGLAHNSVPVGRKSPRIGFTHRGACCATITDPGGPAFLNHDDCHIPSLRETLAWFEKF